MPEGPELHLASRFVNQSCIGRIFSGKIEKNPVHKCSDIEFDATEYTIAAASRGKEMQLTLTKLDRVNIGKSESSDGGGDKKKKTPRGRKKTIAQDQDETDDKKKLKIPETLKILFRFGMSGNFQFTTLDDIHKHAHLKFYTNDKPLMVLSYVDIRRFGRWEVGADWSKNRGPDPMFEYQAFRSKVVENINKAAFDQPICETMLNQKFFNGIGNYLRAEILYRLRIPPFEKARTVLEGLSAEPPDVKPMKGGAKKGEQPDLLHLCHTVPLEVIAIGAGGYTADGKASDYSDFMKWLQCYYQDGMKNMVDHNARTIWFSGPPGPMTPKDEKSRNIRSPKKRPKATDTDNVQTKVKSKRKEGSDIDVPQKSSKRPSKRKSTATSATEAVPKAPRPSQKRRNSSKEASVEKSEESQKGKSKKGKGTSKSVQSGKELKKKASVKGRKKGKINAQVREDEKTEIVKQNGVTSKRGKGPQRISRRSAKQK
nr:endonuclease 8-like 1 [Lytechinus pictus]